MTTTSAKLYSLEFANKKTYLFATMFIVGNVLFPQLAHALIPQGGLIFLPIYFFTLIGAYKYGIRVGLLTALLSPVINHLLFGMPPAPMLPIILIKSSVLAIAAALAARHFGKVSFMGIVLAVVAYQLIGGGAEFLLTQSIAKTSRDFLLGYPGIILQLAGGFLLLKSLEKV